MSFSFSEMQTCAIGGMMFVSMSKLTGGFGHRWLCLELPELEKFKAPAEISRDATVAVVYRFEETDFTYNGRDE